MAKETDPMDNVMNLRHRRVVERSCALPVNSYSLNEVINDACLPMETTSITWSKSGKMKVKRERADAHDTLLRSARRAQGKLGFHARTGCHDEGDD